jgi:ATPase subunit of ABC transporter with duplicated ATPase domains
VAQPFAEICNGHHKKSVSRTMMSIRPETSTHTPSGDAQIRVRGAAKRYGALQVFRGIEFNVGEREIVAIVGRPAAARQRCYAVVPAWARR